LTVDVGAEIGQVYLPLVFQGYQAAPDLVVRSIVATTNNVQVVIANVGDGPATDDFWVDAYIDPAPPPAAVNQIWNDLCDQGLVWGVTTDMAAGSVLTLTVNGAYYSSHYSQVSWPLPVGAGIYAQVDAWNPATSYGAVLENHERTGGAYNNIAGPVQVTDGSAGLESVFPAWPLSPPAADLPPERR
jgi:hypothetical protein